MGKSKVIVDLDAMRRHGLKPSEALLLSIVKSYCRNGAPCHLTNKQLAEHLNESERKVVGLLNSLESKNLIRRDTKTRVEEGIPRSSRTIEVADDS